MRIITGKFAVKPEKRQELIKLAQGMFTPSRAESGCISYHFYEDSETSNSFLFFEEWESQEALDNHFQTPHYQDFILRFPNIIEGKPSIKIYDVAGLNEL